LVHFDFFVSQLQLAHQFVHRVAVEELGDANQANLGGDSRPLLVIDWEVALVVDASRTRQVPTELTAFQLLRAVAAHPAPRPVLQLLVFVIRQLEAPFEDLVIHVEHNLDLVIDSDVQELLLEFGTLHFELVESGIVRRHELLRAREDVCHGDLARFSGEDRLNFGVILVLLVAKANVALH